MSSFGGAPPPTRAHSPPRNGTTTPTPRSPAAKRYKSDGVGDGPAPPRVRTPTRSPRRSSQGSPAPGRSPSDRFIPNRTSMDFDEANHALSVVASPQRKKGDDPAANARPVEVEFRRAMRSALLPRSSGGGRRSSGGADSPRSPPHSASKIFRFGAEVQNRPDRFRSALEVIADPRQEPGNDARTAALARPVPTKPSRILDAPDIVDDYYLNLLSWSSSNVLAVALANNVYLWNAATNEVSELLQLEQGDCVTSVSWAPGGSHLCVGTDSAAVQLWDASRMALVRSMRGHTARVGSLAWNPVSRCVNSGSRDALVLQHDARARQHRTATLVGHQQEVCGLSWSADGATLASGGNENYLCLWDAARSGQAQPSECAPRAIMRQHQAAVKALSWCPMHRNLLASGGGTADRTIKFWNAHTGAMLHSVDTGSQVCALLWSRHHKEIVSSHGFSQNQLCLWRYPSMTKLCELTGHTARVLHLAQSPDGETVVSAAADETLRFWSIFGGGPTSAARRKGRMRDMRLSSVGGEMSIR
ncbi:unnamed protein product [Pelagomonas calceolata]|uniref:CDC20/Fizzy WD40 domain-containing protein n=1 Tax=Pelagomonas calceolata TaxID=35677 RepID=A0A8J2SNV6_9STRA|nr:unnamed protein product [Pelagomonas calceolata]